jgi:hypothetical protein
MNNIFDKISDKVLKASLPPRILLSKFRFIDEQYSRECLDPHYLPFHYYLGTHFPAKNLLEIGFGLGLNTGCYLMGCKDVENYLTIQEPQDVYYSSRMGIANIKQVWRKKIDVFKCPVHDETFLLKMRERKWDLVLINEKSNYDTHMLWLNTIWDVVSEGGLICMDHTTHPQVKRAYNDFCIIKRREPYIFPTRYGIGAVSR